jgi:MFS family permease
MTSSGGTPQRSFTTVVSVLRLPQFAAYWVAGAASSTGTWIHRTVAMVLVWDLTQSALAVGLLATAATLPVLLFALAAGSLSDRFDRRRIIIVTHLISAGSAFALAVYAAGSGREAAAPIAVAFIMATCWAFAKPALSAYFPSLIPTEAMRAATAANSMNFIVGQIVGPVIGTVFVATGQVALAFVFNAVTFVVPAVVVARLPAAVVPSMTTRPGASRLDSIREALPTPNIALLAIVAVTAGVADVLRNLSPVVVDAMGASQDFTGFVVTAVSIGSAVGTLSAGVIGARIGDGRGVAAGLGVQAASLLILAVWFHEATVLVAGVATGLGFSWAFVLLTSELQSRTRDGMRGRVMALHSLAHLGVRPATTLATSAAAGTLGVVAALVGNGVVALATIGLISAAFSQQASLRSGAATALERASEARKT